MGLSLESEQVQSLPLQMPSRRPMAWQVPWQKDTPRLHLLGSRVLRLSREIFSSEHLSIIKCGIKIKIVQM